jgi:hypothetical protein
MAHDLFGIWWSRGKEELKCHMADDVPNAMKIGNEGKV